MDKSLHAYNTILILLLTAGTRIPILYLTEGELPSGIQSLAQGKESAIRFRRISHISRITTENGWRALEKGKLYNAGIRPERGTWEKRI